MTTPIPSSPAEPTETDPTDPVPDPVVPDPKTPLESKTILACLVGIVTFLAVVGYHYKGTTEDLKKIADGLVVLIPLAAMTIAAIFRRFGDGGKVVSSTEKHTLKLMGRMPSQQRAQARALANNATLRGQGVRSQESRHPFPPGTPLTLLAIGLTLVCAASGGCMSRAEYVTFREGLNQVDQPILDEHRAWAEALATDPKKLPNLFDNETPADRQAWLDARLKWHAERTQFMEDSRANDVK